MAWLRLYDNILDDPKIQMLSDGSFRLLINLWCLAKRNDGFITNDLESLSFSLRLTSKKLESTLQNLIDAHLLDREENGFKPHNWESHQYVSDLSTVRVKRFRKRRETQSETPPETDTESDTETETESKKQEGALTRTPSKREGRRGTSLPEIFPTLADIQAACALWRERGRDDLCDRVADEAAQFRDHHASRGTVAKDWPATWRTWVRNALKFNRKQDHGRSNNNFAAAAAELIGDIRAGR